MSTPHSKTVIQIVVLALALRLLLLGTKSFWLDEATSELVASLGQDRLWAGRSELYHPPLFYLILAQWQRFGTTDFHLRLIAALPGTLSIPLIYQLGSRWLDRAAGITAAALAAVSPLLIWYSQEMRSYMLVTLLGLQIMLCATNLFENRSPIRNTCCLAVGMSAMLYLHYFGAFFIPLTLLLLAILAALGRASWRSLSLWLLAIVAAIISYIPWLQTPSAAYFARLAAGSNYLTRLANLNISLNPSVLSLFLLVATIVAVIVTYFAAKWFAQRNVLEHIRQNYHIQLLIALGICLSLVIFVIPRGYSLKRQIVAFWPYALIFVASLWPWQVRSKRFLTIILLLSLAASLVNIVFVPKAEWRDAQALIAENWQTNDIVVLAPFNMTTPFDHYDRNTHRQQGINVNGQPDQLAELQAQNSRIWYVTQSASFDPERRNERLLGQNGEKVAEYRFFRVRVQLFISHSFQK